MAFNLDYSESNENSLIPAGTYECVIREAYEDATKGGTVFINVPLVVRNDLEQPRKNACIWHSIWKKKAPDEKDLAVGGYTAFAIRQLSMAAGLAEGSHFETIQDWMGALKEKPVQAVVEHELNSYTNKVQARVKRIQPTAAPDCKHQFKAKAAQATSQQSKPAANFDVNSEDVEDLPF